MLDKLGETYEGVITTVTNFGIFVELKDIYVEGLIHITALGQDYYHYDSIHHRLIGERTAKIYRLGDPVNVVVARVDLDEKKIDFDMADTQPVVKQPYIKPTGAGVNAGKKGQKKSGKKKVSKKTTGKKKTANKKTRKKKTSQYRGKKKAGKKKAGKKQTGNKTAGKKTGKKQAGKKRRAGRRS
jgi:ribonuclease R